MLPEQSRLEGVRTCSDDQGMESLGVCFGCSIFAGSVRSLTGSLCTELL